MANTHNKSNKHQQKKKKKRKKIAIIDAQATPYNFALKFDSS